MRELSNHLSNVLATVSDKKIAVMNGANLSHYRADVVSYSDYYPFGAPMTERTAVVTPTDVRYGFNGQESDDEVYGVSGTSYTAEFWQYDSRLGRRWNVDPVGQFNSPYLALADNPIVAIDPSGAWVPVVTETKTVNADKTETKSGYLSAQMEDGDNAETLSKFLSIDIEQATALFNGMGEAKSIAVPEVIAAPINAAIRDSYNPSMNDYKDDWYIADGLETNYNCWESALSISQGQTPDFNNVIEWGGTYAQALRDQTQYENVSENPDAFEFGRTAIRYAVDHERWIGDYNETTHGAIYLGQSKDGTMYVWSKNGKIDAPKIMKQNDVIKMYGKVQGSGPTPNEGGFYNYIGQ